MSSSSARTHGTVVIDQFPEAVFRYGTRWAVVAVDVIRASTTAITAVQSGRRCYPVDSAEAAREKAATLMDPLLAGELAGRRPPGFEMGNSPAEMSSRTDRHRPAVLVSSSGTRLMANAGATGHGFAACFRNSEATARHLADRYPRVAVVGAGTRGRFREEDQACCARIADLLTDLGYRPGSQRTRWFLDRWRSAPADAWLGSDSVRYLRRSGQEEDLEYILSHRDDLRRAFRLSDGEIAAEEARGLSGIGT